MNSSEQPTSEQVTQVLQDPEGFVQSKIGMIAPYLVPVVQRILRKKKQLLIFNGSLIGLTVLFLLFVASSYYDVTLKILPDYGGKAIGSSFGDLAALAGLTQGQSTPTEIYAGLLRTESVLRPVVMASYAVPEAGDTMNLIEYFNVQPDLSLPEHLRERMMYLEVHSLFNESVISTDVDAITKVLTATVRMDNSRIAAEVLNNLAASLDEYVRTKRKSNATNQRFYIEKRIREVADSLTAAEQRVLTFQTENRNFAQSPPLMLELTRLRRQQVILESVYNELNRQIELIKIDEIKDIPIVNVMEPAGDPILRTGPKRRLIVMAVTFLSLVFSTVYVAAGIRFTALLSMLRRMLFPKE